MRPASGMTTCCMRRVTIPGVDVTVALAITGAAREGLLALSVDVGLGVVHELMELEVGRGGAVGSAEVRDLAAGLSQQPGEAGGSPGLEPWVRTGAAPTTFGDDAVGAL